MIVNKINYLLLTIVFNLFYTPYSFSLATNSPAAITIYSINPSLIFVKGAGGIDSSTIVFEVRDSLGFPVTSGVSIKFTLIRNRVDGDQYIIPTSGITDLDGRISTILYAGFLSDFFFIQANIDSPKVKSQPVPINIIRNPTEVSINKEQYLRDFALLQNYPNPFNPTTVISYRLSANSLTTLKVYDVLGREVAVLVNEVKNAGTYSVQWNASQFSSGVYFAKMTAGNFTSTKKLLLVK